MNRKYQINSHHFSGKVIIFWDYDTQWGGDQSRLPEGPKSWGHLEFENTERLLELHDFYDIPACFAVVGAAALPGNRPYHDPRQVRRISEMGHEVASHSMYHEWLPGLGYSKLLRTLTESKDQLEQCIGNPIVSFIPPFNQPFDYASKWSISLSERREAGRDRIDLPRLFEALISTGYLSCRVSYHPIYERILTRILGKQWISTTKVEKIGGVICIRLLIRAGFGDEAIRLMEHCVKVGDYAVIYGHPHSLHSGNFQDERYLIPFLEKVRHLRSNGQLQVLLPRQLVCNGGQT